MAKTKANDPYEYTFQPKGDNILVVKKIHCDEPEDITSYEIKGINLRTGRGGFCDCPASMHRTFKGECKHKRLAQRWADVRQQVNLKEGEFLVYRQATDAFYHNTSLSGDAPDAVVPEAR
jgi:hypothetical protein